MELRNEFWLHKRVEANVILRFRGIERKKKPFLSTSLKGSLQYKGKEYSGGLPLLIWKFYLVKIMNILSGVSVDPFFMFNEVNDSSGVKKNHFENIFHWGDESDDEWVGSNRVTETRVYICKKFKNFCLTIFY